jgi:hypothetical protein
VITVSSSTTTLVKDPYPNLLTMGDSLSSAEGAAISPSLGRRPRDSSNSKTLALKARFNLCLLKPAFSTLNRAFSAQPRFGVTAWGVAPGCRETAPLALNTHGLAAVGSPRHTACRPTTPRPSLAKLRRGKQIEAATASRDFRRHIYVFWRIFIGGAWVLSLSRNFCNSALGSARALACRRWRLANDLLSLNKKHFGEAPKSARRKDASLHAFLL